MAIKESIFSILLVDLLVLQVSMSDKSKVMNFFKNIEGKHILSGSFGGFAPGPYQRFGESQTFSLSEAEAIHSLTNKYPAIISMDCGTDTSVEPGKEPDLVNCFNKDLLSHAKRGGIVTFSVLMPNPILPGNKPPKNYSRAYDFQITNEEYRKLITEGTPERTRLFKVYDKIAEGIAAYDAEGVTVLYRSYQEVNLMAFWWGNSGYELKDEERMEIFKTLWREHHDYLTNVKGLKNIIWVYAPYTWDSFKTGYYPGGDYVDIVALDAYMNNFNWLVGYEEMLSFGKPFALAEVGPLHDGNMTRLIFGKMDYGEMVNVINKRYPKVIYFVAHNAMWSPTRNLNAYEAFNNPRVLNLGDFAMN